MSNTPKLLIPNSLGPGGPAPKNVPFVHFVKFRSRDGLERSQPCGRLATALTNKAFRTLHSALVAPGDDAREAPKPEDLDFKQRTRQYSFHGLEVEDGTGVVSAIYLEE